MLDRLLTEGVNANTLDIDTRSSPEIVQLINAEDAKVAEAVRLELPQIARAVDIIVERLRAGGHLFYVGAGTSGRLGVLDASEMPPTYSVPPDLVRGIICGGPTALTTPVERMEDDADLGASDLLAAGAAASDIVVGIAASGRTPYVIGALTKARELGAATVAIACNRPSEIGVLADIEIAPLVGPEVIAGSTRHEGRHGAEDDAKHAVYRRHGSPGQNLRQSDGGRTRHKLEATRSFAPHCRAGHRRLYR